MVQGLYHLLLSSEKTFRERLHQSFLYTDVRECSNGQVRDVFFDLVYIFLGYSLFILVKILIKSYTKLSLFPKQHSFYTQAKTKREHARKRKRQCNLNTTGKDRWNVNWGRNDKLETVYQPRARGDDNTNVTILSLYIDVIDFLHDSLNFGRAKNVENKSSGKKQCRNQNWNTWRKLETWKKIEYESRSLNHPHSYIFTFIPFLLFNISYFLLFSLSTFFLLPQLRIPTQMRLL